MQWFERKKDVPKGDPANLELARDLASCSVDGGVVLVGVRDKIDDATALVGVSNVNALRHRISQVAIRRITPALNVDIVAIPNPSAPDSPVLMVVVPASADAPHMADEKYWGRSATGKRTLTDAEASRLWSQRHNQREDFHQQLLAMSDTLDPIPASERQFGHLYLYARSATPPTTSVTDALETQFPSNWIRETATFTPEFSPALSLLDRKVHRPDGLGVASHSFAEQRPGFKLYR